MIWHFLEVWLLVAIAFGVGCVLGAFLYGVIGDSRLVTTQGVVADGIGDVLDGVKARLGLGPAWRPHHLRSIERPALPEVADAQEAVDEYDEFDDELVFDEEPPEDEREETRALESPESQSPPVSRISTRPALDEPSAPRVQLAEPLFAGGDPDRVQSAMLVGDDGVVPMRPAGLSGPRGGVPDNLTRIRGIGGRNEELLNSLGIFHFGQIAAWTPGEVRWIGQYLAFPERIERDDWVGQAMVLASGGETGFEKSAERRRRRRRLDQQAFLARQVALGVATVMKGEPNPPEENDEPEASNADESPDDDVADDQSRDN
jgi:hypothetical protein